MKRNKKLPPFMIKYNTTIHFITYVASIFIITPFDNQIIPLFIWAAMLIASGLIITHIASVPGPLKLMKMNLIEYKKPVSATLTSSILFLLSCIAFKWLAVYDITIPLTLSVFAAGMIYYSILLYINSVDDNQKQIAKKAFFIAKTIWIIISFICYVFARKLLMDVTDVTWESTFNRITSFGFFIIFFTILFSMIFLTIITILPILQNSSLPFHAMTVLFPLFCAGYIFFIVYSVNTSQIMEFILKTIIKYDTRDSFYCNETYQVLPDFRDARYMMISEGNYRIFNPENNDYSMWRLMCKTTPPGYTLVRIKNRKDIIDDTKAKPEQ
ncbi:hypothetical protein SB6421_04317 [Klebsiella huaxiensis]|uniref:hypothetical protein n=1 Tax=Klebsiella huaxiensis TaxID=2153354 RepID=UPI00116ACE52|nr:hypothetical protein [Klebsiella huaxiensis]VUS92717.1 hypothetical protein SB6421_04317 [Klebsiella huaxiensis]